MFAAAPSFDDSRAVPPGVQLLALGWGAACAALVACGTRGSPVAAAAGVALACAAALLDHAGLVSLRPLRVEHEFYAGRLYGPFHHPAWFAEYLLLALPWMWLDLPAARGRERALAAAVTVALGACVLLT